MNCFRIRVLSQVTRVVLIVFSLCFLGAPTTHGADNPQRIENILEDMKTQGTAFDPGELITLGKEGLGAILDILMPESAGYRHIGLEETELLTRDLGHAQFSRRKNAVAQLVYGGVYVRESVKAASACTDDLEIALNAKQVLQRVLSPTVKTDRQQNGQLTQDYGKAYGRYLAKLQAEDCWRLIAVRTTQSLFCGRDSTGSSNDFMWQSFTTLAKRGEDSALSLFRPVIQLKNESLSRWVFNGIRAYCRKGFTPTVLQEIVGTDHVYNDSHLRRRLRHLRENGHDIPYKADVEEVRLAFDALRKAPDGPKTKTFLSYEAAALDLLFSLPEDDSHIKVKVANREYRGIIKKGNARKKQLAIETAQHGRKDLPLKDISLLSPLITK
jgi:hypothetical protein